MQGRRRPLAVPNSSALSVAAQAAANKAAQADRATYSTPPAVSWRRRARIAAPQLHLQAVM